MDTRQKSFACALITVHDRDEVVVGTAKEFGRLQGEQMGRALISGIQTSPHRDVEIEVPRSKMPVRKTCL